MGCKVSSDEPYPNIDQNHSDILKKKEDEHDISNKDDEYDEQLAANKCKQLVLKTTPSHKLLVQGYVNSEYKSSSLFPDDLVSIIYSYGCNGKYLNILNFILTTQKMKKMQNKIVSVIYFKMNNSLFRIIGECGSHSMEIKLYIQTVNKQYESDYIIFHYHLQCKQINQSKSQLIRYSFNSWCAADPFIAKLNIPKDSGKDLHVELFMDILQIHYENGHMYYQQDILHKRVSHILRRVHHYNVNQKLSLIFGNNFWFYEQQNLHLAHLTLTHLPQNIDKLLVHVTIQHTDGDIIDIEHYVSCKDENNAIIECNGFNERMHEINIIILEVWSIDNHKIANEKWKCYNIY